MRRGAGFETLLRCAVLALALVLPFLLGLLTTYVLLLLLIIIVGYLALQQRTARPSLDLAGKLFFLAFLVMAADIAINAMRAGHWHDLLYAFDFGMLVFYGPLAALLDRGAKPANSGIVANVALAGTLFALLIGIVFEVVQQPYRFEGINSDPIRFSDTAVLTGFLSLMGVLAFPGPRRWIYLLGPPSSLAVAVMTGSRSALLAFPLLLVLAIVVLVERKRVALAVIAASTAAGALVVALLAQWFSVDRAASAIPLVRHLLTGATVTDETTLQRFAIYRAGVQAFWQSPILGVGWHNKMEAIRPYLPPEYESLANLTHLHDEVLNFAVGMGVVGVLVYLALLVVPIVVCLKSPRDSQFRARLYGCILLVASYVTLGLADVMLSFELHTALYVAFTALLLSYCRDRPAAKSDVDRTATPAGLEV